MGTHAYHRIERERRFLLDRLPGDLGSFHRRCTDHYLEGTRLRLRSLAPSDGGPTEYKLGQKHHPAGLGVDEREMTTLYLTEAEYIFLARRLGRGVHPLIKRRYPYVHAGLTYSIDVFEGEREGLILADLEHADPAVLHAAPIPPWAVREVTADARYEGGTLARAGL